MQGSDHAYSPQDACNIPSAYVVSFALRLMARFFGHTDVVDSADADARLINRQIRDPSSIPYYTGPWTTEQVKSHVWRREITCVALCVWTGHALEVLTSYLHLCSRFDGFCVSGPGL